MRLAAKRRSSWTAAIEELLSVGSHLPTRSGRGELVRLGKGEPIVLIPGLAGGVRLLAPLARCLALRNEVFLVGLRGDEGVLSRDQDQGIESHAADIASTLERLGLERPTVFGVSFGGVIALELAIEHPRQVGGLILQGTEARFSHSDKARLVRRVLERYPLPSNNPFLNQFFNLLHGCKPEPGPLVDFVLQRCWSTDQAVVASRLWALEEFDATERLWRVDAPTLVLGGTRDVIVKPEAHRALTVGIAGAQFQSLDGAGHLGFLTHRRDVARHVWRHSRVQRRSLC